MMFHFSTTIPSLEMRMLGFVLAIACVGAVQLQVPFTNQAISFNSPIHTTDSWSWENCGFSDDLVEIKSIQLSPDPPVRGKDLTITASGAVKQTIVDGSYADVAVKLGLIKLLTKRFDICEEAVKADLDVKCPVGPGDYTITHTVTIPKEAPPGRFGIDISAYNAEDEDLLCLKLKLDWKLHT